MNGSAGTGDFDFFVGTWDVANRRRTDFLDASSEWEEFPGVTHGSRHFDGGAHFDEIDFPTKGSTGLTLRLYDPELARWSLYWASKRTGTLFPPVTGAFRDGRGEFHGDDTYEGTPVLVRFVWSGITEDAARWEQAFSVDGGTSWLTNWVMEFERRRR
ncbi:hypothetical protein [Streptomyces candidus]|uniref:DUF1579 domain-containing protein n=1 Tax=Streptomyces candidus TaxID=67283 RepID=A0A7X0LTB1_9ACTN|nr:hypothetical protein [Streptomyces candidus]MBB6439259.1 hypothetical protein [Streptomyces candidus]GHH44846.1 hypothetical protein GCM10018773_33140 [Streptomyces candidus]